MTPDEKPVEEPGRPRFREGRSAFREETTPEETAPAEEHPPVGPAPGGPSAPAADEPPSAPPADEARPTEPPRVEPPRSEPPRSEPPYAEPPRAEPPHATPSAGDDPDLAALETFELPDPSFLEIVEILATQALQFLGDAPLTERGDRAVFPRHAKHVIDLLGILEERTRGNLPDEEREYLAALLDELRTRFLRVAP